MKRIVTILAAIVLAVLSTNVYAQKNKPENDYNLKKAYEVLNEEKDEAKALDLVTKQLRETPDNVDALILRTGLQDINHAQKINKPKKSNLQNLTLINPALPQV